MRHIIRVIHTEPLVEPRRHYTPPAMYDDHLLAWMGHLHAKRGATVAVGVRAYLTERQRERIRALRPTMKVDDLARMFGVDAGTIQRVCQGLRFRVMDRRPVESADRWWPDAQACGADFGLTVSAVRNCLTGKVAHIGGRMRTGTAVWYSKHPTREAWEAARRVSA